MKVITSAADCDKVAIAATIGMFDGVHLGHITLINSLKREAAKRGLATAVVTFRDHPQNVLHGGNVKWICSLNDRIASIAATGVDYLILMDFDQRLAALDSTAFMVMLKRNFGLKALVVGFNHRFGHNRSETFSDYQANGRKIGVEVVKAEEYNGVYAPVSSSIIRHLIVGGDVEAGLAIAEMIASMKKPTVSLVLGGSHSIGVPIAVSAEYSYIVPTGTMVIHPVRMSGTVIGSRQTFTYMNQMQNRINSFICSHSKIKENKLSKFITNTDILTKDIGSILTGAQAVEAGLINEVGGIRDAIKKLRKLMNHR